MQSPTPPKWYEQMDARQISEVELALIYERDFHHGTDGHNRLLLVAKMAHMLDYLEGYERS